MVSRFTHPLLIYTLALELKNQKTILVRPEILCMILKKKAITGMKIFVQKLMLMRVSTMINLKRKNYLKQVLELSVHMYKMELRVEQEH